MREKSQIIPAKFIPNFCFEATVFHKFLVAYIAEKEKDTPILLTQARQADGEFTAESWTREDTYSLSHSTFLQLLAFILVSEVKREEGGKGQEDTSLQRETDTQTDVNTHVYAFSHIMKTLTPGFPGGLKSPLHLWPQCFFILYSLPVSWRYSARQIGNRLLPGLSGHIPGWREKTFGEAGKEVTCRVRRLPSAVWLMSCDFPKGKLSS